MYDITKWRRQVDFKTTWDCKSPPATSVHGTNLIAVRRNVCLLAIVISNSRFSTVSICSACATPNNSRQNVTHPFTCLSNHWHSSGRCLWFPIRTDMGKHTIQTYIARKTEEIKVRILDNLITYNPTIIGFTAALFLVFHTHTRTSTKTAHFTTTHSISQITFWEKWKYLKSKI